MKEIYFYNKSSNKYKKAPLGFSWTTLFFGCFPALFRGDWKWGSIGFLLAWITGGISWLIFPFFYNKLYIKDLLNNGYLPETDNQCEYLIMKNYISKYEMELLKNK